MSQVPGAPVSSCRGGYSWMDISPQAGPENTLLPEACSPRQVAGAVARHLRGRSALIDKNQPLRRDPAGPLREGLLLLLIRFRTAFASRSGTSPRDPSDAAPATAVRRCHPSRRPSVARNHVPDACGEPRRSRASTSRARRCFKCSRRHASSNQRGTVLTRARLVLARDSSSLQATP